MHDLAASLYAAPAVAARTLSTYGALMDEVRPGSGHGLEAGTVEGYVQGAMPSVTAAAGPADRAGAGDREVLGGKPGAGSGPGARGRSAVTGAGSGGGSAVTGAGSGGGSAVTGAGGGSARNVDPAATPLVVGLVRELASRRLAALPPELVARLTVATFAEPEPRRPQPGRWFEHDPERDYLDRLGALGGPLADSSAGRFLSAVRSPRREAARRDLIARRADVRREGIDAFLLSAWAAAGRPEFVLALDADDVLVVRALVAAGARLAPGGLRWLVDRWDEAGRPTD
jgi:hypothetical protein